MSLYVLSSTVHAVLPREYSIYTNLSSRFMEYKKNIIFKNPYLKNRKINFKNQWVCVLFGNAMI